MTKARPRILFVSHTAQWAGTNSVLLLLLKHLRERYDASVLLPGEGPFSQVLDEEGVRYFSFPALTKRSIASIYRLIRRQEIGLVYGNGIMSSSRNALIAARAARVPFISHVHEMGWGKSWWKIGYLMRFANATIAVSNTCADSIARFTPRGRLHVVHNGIALSEPPPSREAARAYLLSQTSLSNKDTVIINVGTVCARKGQTHAVEVLEQVVSQEPSARLVMAGSLDRTRDGSYVGQVRSMVRERGLEDKVRFTGFRSDIMTLVEGADIFLHTAVVEPYGLVVVEAMALGLPVVAFATDGVTEIVRDGETGWLVPAGDVAGAAEATLKLAASPMMRRDMGLAGRHRVESEFSAKATVERVAQVIEDVLRPAKQTARS